MYINNKSMAFEEFTRVNLQILFCESGDFAAVWLNIPLWWDMLLLRWLVCSQYFEQCTVLVFSVG